jgi:RNA-directed DNA polymerase
MIESVLKWKNIDRAIRQTIGNKGASGVDKMPVSELKDYVQTHKNKLFTSIINQQYVPQAIRGVEIPKANGKTRLLGVPTVVDRMLQQAVNQSIAPHFELEFKDESYGFRPQRNAQQAVLQAQKNINEGYKHIVDIDLKSFFDEVEHPILLQLIYRKVKCPTTLRLIRKWLQAPILIKGKLTKRRKGIPQGSPLSPLLSNIMLHELDKYLTVKKQKFVRYADDFSIYCKSKLRAKEIGNQVFLYLKDKLHLPINREKSGIRRPSSFTILGYGFTSAYEKGVKGKYQLIVSEKSWKKLKGELKEITRKTSPQSFDMRISKLKQVQRGWVNYFRLASITSKLQKVDSWLRNRLRYCIWKDWKKPERKRKNLIRLGIPRGKAYAYSRTRKGGWAIAQSPILTTTITLKRLIKRGYESLELHYLKVSPMFNEPLYTRPVRTVV